MGLAISSSVQLHQVVVKSLGGSAGRGLDEEGNQDRIIAGKEVGHRLGSQHEATGQGQGNDQAGRAAGEGEGAARDRDVPEILARPDRAAGDARKGIERRGDDIDKFAARFENRKLAPNRTDAITMEIESIRAEFYFMNMNMIKMVCA